MMVKINALAERSIQDTLNPVRPGGVNGSPFWNRFSIQFIYAPAFEFFFVDKASAYLFSATDRYGIIHSFTAESPQAALSPIWRELPTGPVFLTVSALDPEGKTIGCAGKRTFYRGAPFTNTCPPKKYSYAEGIKKGSEYIFNMNAVQGLADGKLDPEYLLFCYPSKMLSRIITEMIYYSQLEPSRKERALKIACGAAEHLMETAIPAGQPLEYLPLTYEGVNGTAKELGGTIMMLYPAQVGSAMLQLYAVIGEKKFLDYVIRIGEQYLRLQQPNGSWYLVYWIESGQPKVENYCLGTEILQFLEQLSDVTGEAKYRLAAEKFIPHMKMVMESFNWEGQFEDSKPQAIPYWNLTKHNATSAYLYMCAKYPDDKALIRGAREVQRFAEDQFIIWEQPGWVEQYDMTSGNEKDLESCKWGWHRYQTPCVLEQYFCYVPVNASSAKMIRYYLMMYDLEKDPLDLAKARALGDGIIMIQGKDGRISTWMNPDSPLNNDWINCDIVSIEALRLLAEYDSVIL